MEPSHTVILPSKIDSYIIVFVTVDLKQHYIAVFLDTSEGCRFAIPFRLPKSVELVSSCCSSRLNPKHNYYVCFSCDHRVCSLSEPVKVSLEYAFDLFSYWLTPSLGPVEGILQAKLLEQFISDQGLDLLEGRAASRELFRRCQHMQKISL